jgi:hypothetical protein
LPDLLIARDRRAGRGLHRSDCSVEEINALSWLHRTDGTSEMIAGDEATAYSPPTAAPVE